MPEGPNKVRKRNIPIRRNSIEARSARASAAVKVRMGLLPTWTSSSHEKHPSLPRVPSFDPKTTSSRNRGKDLMSDAERTSRLRNAQSQRKKNVKNTKGAVSEKRASAGARGVPNYVKTSDARMSRKLGIWRMPTRSANNRRSKPRVSNKNK